MHTADLPGVKRRTHLIQRQETTLHNIEAPTKHLRGVCVATANPQQSRAATLDSAECHREEVPDPKAESTPLEVPVLSGNATFILHIKRGNRHRLNIQEACVLQQQSLSKGKLPDPKAESTPSEVPVLLAPRELADEALLPNISLLSSSPIAA